MLNLFLIILSSCVFGNEDIKIAEKTIRSLRAYKIDSISYLISKVNSQPLKDALEAQFFKLTQEKPGYNFPNLNSDNDLDNFTKSIISFTIGDYLIKPYQDSIAFNKYLDAYKYAVLSKNNLLINESLCKLNGHMMKNTNRPFSVFRKYIDLYKNHAKEPIDIFWSFYYEFMLLLQTKEKVGETLSFNDIDIFKRGEKLLYDNHYLSGRYYQLKGVVHSFFLKNYEVAVQSYELAKGHYEQLNIISVKSNIYSCSYNRAIANFYLKNYDLSIKEMRTASKSMYFQKNSYINEHLYGWLSKSYDSLGIIDSAHYFYKKMIEIREYQEQLKHSRAIKKIDTEYEVDKKNNAIENLKKEKKDLQDNLNTILPILGSIILLLAIVFLLYKRYKKKSRSLEDEKSETLQKLDELKNIVIKNYIVLKDKTKVYISDLVYIKSDDHYLQIYLSSGKKYLVRGKIKQIREELPPNFIQCHRSYIVNSNFVKKINRESLILIGNDIIPISRSYRNKF